MISYIGKMLPLRGAAVFGLVLLFLLCWIIPISALVDAYHTFKYAIKSDAEKYWHTVKMAWRVLITGEKQ